jgi:spermidine synthase
MGGLALGSYVIGRWVERRGQALKIYAALEVALGVLVLLVPHVLAASQPLYSSVYERAAGGLGLVTLVRTVHALLLLLLPTALIGGTLPALSLHLAATGGPRAGATLGTTAARLYAVNTLGAVTGILVAVAFLIPSLGTRRAGIACAFLNIVVGCAAWLVATTWPRTAAPVQGPVAGRGVSSTDPRPRAQAGLAVAALSGFAALGYQMIWVRAVALNTADTIFGFGATVSAYRAGIALGARLLADRPLKNRGWSHLAACQWGLAVFAMLSPFVIRLLLGSASDLVSTTPATLLARPWLLVLVALLVPTTLMGGSLALVFRLHRQDIPGLASASGIGAVYASSTLGAIAGSLVTGMLLIPRLARICHQRRSTMRPEPVKGSWIKDFQRTGGPRGANRV